MAGDVDGLGPVQVADDLAAIVKALGMDPTKVDLSAFSTPAKPGVPVAEF